jgi:hypothetical protein
MTAQQLLNTVGLVLSMVGVVIIFKYGPPQPNLEEGVALGLEGGNRLPDGRTVAEHDRDVAALRDTHQRMSKVGLGLVFVGFAFQLWATWS